MKRTEFDARLNELLLAAERLIPEENLPDLPFMEQAPAVHGWYDFEHKIWEAGEDVRQLIRSERKDLNAEQADRVCSICEDIRAKRGRQSFVMLLGKRRYAAYSDRIAAVLTDEDILGHVISTLYKMGAKQFAEQVRPYIDHSVTWIRNEAKRYVHAYEE